MNKRRVPLFVLFQSVFSLDKWSASRATSIFGNCLPSPFILFFKVQLASGRVQSAKWSLCMKGEISAKWWNIEKTSMS
ncbi:unnamed protein product [Caenorhabditis auriculariae]|uniref:Uncharacterized protein n=1 Tax=Caenorhabditis auriculariae TaxID=2777116 RepID=A0A8S1HSS1_9PELO|nr:unnamed protein product [Caenorhabditis auriculariae]